MEVEIAKIIVLGVLAYITLKFIFSTIAFTYKNKMLEKSLKELDKMLTTKTFSAKDKKVGDDNATKKK